MQRNVGRLKKELTMLRTESPHGVSCWPLDDNLSEWEAKLIGGVDTPYEGGVFKLTIQIPQRYPFEPPKISFVTRIYHPNIDDQGRICLDLLKMPPKGSWKPSHNLATVLASIQLLMSEPNPDDGLMADISKEYKLDRPRFVQNARAWVKKYAVEGNLQKRKRLSSQETGDLPILKATKESASETELSQTTTESEQNKQ